MKNNNIHIGADPTSYSPLFIPDNTVVYRKRNILTEEILFSLLCKGILHYCDILRDSQGKVFSIPLNPELTHGGLHWNEILADISLAEVLSGNSIDRSVVPGYDYRTKSYEYITGNNCRVFHKGTYSIFDIDSIEFRLLGEKGVLKEFLSSLKSLLYISDLPGASHLLLELEIPDEIFGNRILNRVNLFLVRYDNPEGKKLFLRQIAHSTSDYRNASKRVLELLDGKEDVWFDEDLQMYNGFIRLLKTIQSIFSTNNYALTEYIDTDTSVLRQEIIMTSRELWKLIKVAIYRLLNK